MKLAIVRNKIVCYCDTCEEEINVCSSCGNYFHDLTLINCDEETGKHYCECCKD